MRVSAIHILGSLFCSSRNCSVLVSVHIIQGMDRPAVRQVQESGGEQRKMEKTGCEIICGPQRLSRLRGR